MLCLPCLPLGYIWDDYYFLTFRGSGDFRAYLLPDPHAAFYRPISQGLYFLLLLFADPTSGLLGHILNLAILAATILLLVLLVSQLCGSRAGLIAGLILASLGLVPGLVAWVSCSQDLLAVAFVLAAFLLRHQGKSIGALACATAAVLCKEPAIAAFPVLVLWDHLVGRPPSRTGLQVIGYASVAVVWALIHPGIHLLAAHGFRSGAAGYVGIEHPGRWGSYLVRYVMTFGNLPPPGLAVSWWGERINYGLAALAALLAGFLFLDRRQPRDQPPAPVSPRRVALIAAIFGIPTLLMPTILIRHWAPYFAFIPAVAFAMALGPFLARQKIVVVVSVLAVFLLLGTRYRGLRAENEAVWTERVFAGAADAARTVRRNFHAVFPSFPKGSQVVVSVSSTGVRGIQSTLLEGQALSVWYRDPTLRSVSTLQRRPGTTNEFLVRVTTDLDVISIDPDTRRVRASNPYAADLTEIGRPLGNYARAVAASGDTDRAVRIALGLAEIESEAGRAYNQRLAAMFLLAADRRNEAQRILDAATSFPRENALRLVGRLLSEPSTSERTDEAAFEAFGLSSTDPEAIRWVMNEFRRSGSLSQAAWYARRLCQISPGDPEGTEMIRAAEQAGTKPQREAT